MKKYITLSRIVKDIKSFLLMSVMFTHTIACDAVRVVIDNVDISEDSIINSWDTLSITHFLDLEDWHNMQGGAIYKDRMVCMMATDGMETGKVNGFIYDLNSGKKECEMCFRSTIDGCYLFLR